MREKLMTLPLKELQQIAKANHIRYAGLRKAELVDRLCMLEEEQSDPQTEKPEKQGPPVSVPKNETNSRETERSNETYSRGTGQSNETNSRETEQSNETYSRGTEQSNETNSRETEQSNETYSRGTEQPNETNSRETVQSNETNSRETAQSPEPYSGRTYRPRRQYGTAERTYRPRREYDRRTAEDPADREIREEAHEKEDAAGAYEPVEELHQEYTDPAEELQKSYAAKAEGETRESDTNLPRRTRTFSYESDEETCGILEIMPDGYGFIRCNNYLPGEEDVYVAPSQIRKFNLQTGDFLRGKLRVRREGERFGALAFLEEVNNASLAETAHRTHFEDLTPVFPNERIYLETNRRNLAMRIVDIVSPVGKGQRGMIVSPPKAGKTTLLKEIARSVTVNYPDIHLIILLIDERPEEVTDIKEAIQGNNVEVIYSTFDELPEHHKRVSEMAIERAKRLVEQKKDVMVLLDSITRLARAYNLTIAPSGRTLSGGLDPAALYMPKKFFGAARNIREGGSLTILATALIETGSRMDDMIFEEFKGTGNMELVLDRKLSERRVFPAIDLLKSGTRRDDLIMTREEKEASDIIRRLSNSSRQDDMLETVMNLFYQTRDNQEFIRKIKVTRL